MTGAARRLVAGGLLALACGGCAPGPPPPWSVLLVTLDTTRADHLGAWGYPHTATPVIDALARQGVRYARCYATAPLTLPSHASLLTGLLPPRHGVRVNGAAALSEEALTLAERLAARGYATGAAVGAFVLDRRFGLAQGFAHYDDDLSRGSDPGRFAYRERDARQVTDAALAWLERDAGRPFFLWVHYFDPHAPYAAPGSDAAGPPPEPFGLPYDAEIGFADAQLGRLLAHLADAGRDRETLVVLTADHGEALGEHGELTHGLFVYDATLHVPLIVRFPDRRAAGRVVETPVSHVDLLPSILSWLGLEPPPGLDGAVLPPGGAPEGERTLYFENHAPAHSSGWSALAGSVRGNAKWIEAPAPERYDLADDPHELRDLHAAGDARSTPGREEFRALLARLESAPRLAGRPAELGDADRERLLALGYVADPHPLAAAGGADPKDMLPVYRAVETAKSRIEQGELAAGVDALAEVVISHDPGNRRAVTILATLALEEEAVRARAIEALWSFARRPSDAELALYARTRLAQALWLERRAEEAAEAFALALEVDEERPGLHYGLGLSYEQLGETGRAASALRRALELAGGEPPPWAGDARTRLAALEAAQDGSP